MRTIFASFDFSSTHLAMEDRNYADIHVAMGKRLPTLRQYVTGLGRPHPDYRYHIVPHSPTSTMLKLSRPQWANRRPRSLWAEDGAAHYYK